MNSPELFSLLVTQIWQVTLLVVLVWLITRWLAADRPHLAHALWILVLLKCLTPPIWSSPTSGFSWVTSSRTSISQSHRRVDLTDTPLTSFRPTPNPIVVFSNFSKESDVSEAEVPLSELPSGGLAAESEMPVSVNWRSMILMVWGVGAGIGLLVTTLRFGLFLHWMGKSKHSASPSLERLVRTLSQRLGIRRRVRLLVLESPVGPAVLGLIRPTIILPASIVTGKSAKEMEPLIAHELIHIRRGDLWWALVQTLAKSLFWFLPLVWFADRMATRESERSCDEETVASLGCSPAAYARGLLDVLEHKHRLHVAPALPGVRPVDITSARLERVMKMRNGIHKRTPVSVWLAMLMLGAFVLPGAAFVLGQDPDVSGHEKVNAKPPATNEPQSSPSEIQHYPKNAGMKLVPLASALTEAADDRTAALNQAIVTDSLPNQWGHRSYDVSDLLEVIRRADLTQHSPEQRLLLELPHRYPGQNSSHQTSLRITDGMLEVDDKVEVLDWISLILKGYREHGFAQIVVETRRITLSMDQINDLEIDWKFHQADSQPSETTDPSPGFPAPVVSAVLLETVVGASGVGENSDVAAVLESDVADGVISASATTSIVSESPTMCALLDQVAAAKLVEIHQTDSRKNITQCPTVTMYDGQSASISDSASRPFVVGFNQVVGTGPEGEPLSAIQPVIRLIPDGLNFHVKATIRDDKTIDVDSVFRISEIVKVDVGGFPVGNRTFRRVQIPEVKTRQYRARFAVPQGETLVFGSLPIEGEDKNEAVLFMVKCVPIFPETPIQLWIGEHLKPMNDIDNSYIQRQDYIAKDGRIVGHQEPLIVKLSPNSRRDAPVAKPEKSPNEKLLITSKTTGVASSKDNLEPIRDALSKIGYDLDPDSNFDYEITKDHLVIRGDRICFLEGEPGEFSFVGDRGEWTVPLDRDDPSPMKFRFQGNVEFKMDEMEVTCKSLTLDVQDKFGGLFKLDINGNATCVLGERELAADRIRFDTDEQLQTVTLEGNARFEGIGKDNAAINLAASRIVWNLETDEFQIRK